MRRTPSPGKLTPVVVSIDGLSTPSMKSQTHLSITNVITMGTKSSTPSTIVRLT